MTELGRSPLHFAMNFYKQLFKESEIPGNILFSSFNIMVSMTLTGAKLNTAQQIQSVLNIDNDRAPVQVSNLLCKQNNYGPDIVLRVASSFYAEKTSSPLESYSALLKESYGSTVVPVNFLSSADKVRLEINKWAEEVTLSRLQASFLMELFTPRAYLSLSMPFTSKDSGKMNLNSTRLKVGRQQLT